MKKRYAKVELVIGGQSRYYISEIREAVGLLDENLLMAAEDEEYRISAVKMTENEFKNLPDFEGW